VTLRDPVRSCAVAACVSGCGPRHRPYGPASFQPLFNRWKFVAAPDETWQIERPVAEESEARASIWFCRKHAAAEVAPRPGVVPLVRSPGT
jgi:hypothetical protein